MEILKYRKVEASFNPWTPSYLEVAQSIINLVSTDKVEVIHIGSTSFRVGGKGIIDLSVLYKSGDLDLAVNHLIDLGFQDQISNKPFPPERPRKDGTVLFKGKEYLVHVHVIEFESEEHKKQVQYKNYMLNDPAAREKYELSKKSIIANGVTEQESYGKEKSPFVKSVLERINN